MSQSQVKGKINHITMNFELSNALCSAKWQFRINALKTLMRFLKVHRMESEESSEKYFLKTKDL